MNQRLVNIDDEWREVDSEVLDGVKNPTAFTWSLDRTQVLEIDVEVRFKMYLEGTGSIEFMGSYPNTFNFYVEQWYIEAIT